MKNLENIEITDLCNEELFNVYGGSDLPGTGEALVAASLPLGVGGIPGVIVGVIIACQK